MYFDGPGFSQPLSDDDSGGHENALLCVELPETGTYRVFSGAYSAVESGTQYTLQATVQDAEIYCEDFSRSPLTMLLALRNHSSDPSTIGVGEERHGSLSNRVLHPQSRLPVDLWILRGDAETQVYVDVVTDEFDADLSAFAVDPEVLTVDDYGQNNNARMEVTIPSGEEVTLLVGSRDPASVGDYMLRVSADPPPLEESRYVGRYAWDTLADIEEIVGIGEPLATIPFGTEIVDVLAQEDDRIRRGFAKVFAYDGTLGEDVVFELISSDFDSFLYLSGPGIDGVMYDDDSASGSNSRIEVQLPKDGRYRVIVSSWEDDSTGTFRLRTFRVIHAPRSAPRTS